MVSIYGSPLHGLKIIENKLKFLCRNVFHVLSNMGVSRKSKIVSRLVSPYQTTNKRIGLRTIGPDFVSSIPVSRGSKISTSLKTHGNFGMREVRNMEPEDFDAAMEKAESVLGEEARAYSKAMRSVFVKVEKLRSKGFSFVQICAACEKSGILPKNANPYCFRQAFRRERARLLAEGELVKLIADSFGAVSKTIVPYFEG
jgi:hypothetical protein